MTILKMLDVNIRHITKDDDSRLADLSMPPSRSLPVLAYLGYGFIIRVPVEDEDMIDAIDKFREHGLSDDFIQLLTDARHEDCQFLKLDVDGETIRGYPVHEW